MRAALASALLLLAAAQPALAAPAVSTVKVSIGPALADQVDEIGQRDLDILTAELRRTVEKRISPSPDGGVLTLVIDDARPNRPTPRQLMTTQGLSMSSFGIGGARISGDYLDPAGNRTPIAYSWYETDIRWAPYSSTWHDAEAAFDRLAVRLARDQFDEKR
ncbi:hypothetical protein ASD38_20365 [Caulobacter sp. Root487D2Y]|uniref:hypothetical protein n=1 Tax=Caulobacter sp. Root487D2Y TaxID=1736547 RepID=UPI0006FE2FCB|nr:hypothetical protein [Caulobacter sp. Root487D2Y]KQY26103.1 hypothetical protein ASD38_20365 [Caulobacter sp. Root487D2Y]